MRRVCVVSASQPAEERTRYLWAANDLTNAIITPASASPLRSYYTPLFYNSNGLCIPKRDQTNSLSRDLRGTASSSHPSHPHTQGDSSPVLGSRRGRSPLHRFRAAAKPDAVPHARPLPHWQGCSAFSSIFEKITPTDAYTLSCYRVSQITRIADKLRSHTSLKVQANTRTRRVMRVPSKLAVSNGCVLYVSYVAQSEPWVILNRFFLSS